MSTIRKSLFALPVRRAVTLTAAGFLVLSSLGAVAAPSADAASRRRPAKPARVRVNHDYSVRVLADSQRVAAGGRAVYPFVLRARNGLSGPVTFDIDGLPVGVAARVRPLGRLRFELELSTPADSPSYSQVGRLLAQSGGRVREALVRLTVSGSPVPPPPPPTVPAPTLPAPTLPPPTLPPAPPPTVPPTTAARGFTVGVDIAGRQIVAGQTATFGVGIARTGGFSASATLDVRGLPPGARAEVAPSPIGSGTTLYVITTEAAPAGRYPLVIAATADGLVRTASTLLVITAAPSAFALAVSPISDSVPSGSTAVYALRVSGAAPSIEVGGLPPGSTMSLVDDPAEFRTLIRSATSPTTPAGTYGLLVTGRRGPVLHTVAIPMTVTAVPRGFGLRAAPSALSVTAGSSVATNVAVTPTGGFADPVTFGATGLPSGASLAGVATPGGALVAIVTTTATPPGIYSVTLTGTSGTLSASIPLALTVR